MSTERLIFTTEALRVPNGKWWRVVLTVTDCRLEGGIVGRFANDYLVDKFSAAEASAELLTMYAISKPEAMAELSLD